MSRYRHILALAAAGVGQVALATPASAAGMFAFLPAALPTVAATSRGCDNVVRPALGEVAASAPLVAPLSKSAAILGGKSSRLEMIAREQSGLVETALPVRAGADRLPGSDLAPAAGGISCAGLAAARLQIATPLTASPLLPLDSENFLASRRLAVRKTSFDHAWSRARRSNLPGAMVRQLDLATHDQGVSAKLSAVNAWTNSRVHYVEDRDLYGRNDYWASAGETLRAGAGDCEDIAIVKMQLLANMGIDRSDMYLTIARDLARNADHAMLVVRVGNKHYLLDNATNEVLDAAQSYDYRPILSFSTNRKWLHGY